jgi:hypothetical protein
MPGVPLSTVPASARPDEGAQDWIAIHALLTALAARGLHDPDRSMQVAALARAVADRLALDAADVAVVEELVALHDVGLIAMPDELLHKPGPLDDDERARLAEHPHIGATIVASLPTLASLAPLVESEHERWDGDGYPNGRRGEDIPLACRIVLACDAYAAMLRPRPDRPALGPDVALAVLRRNAGSQFCPATVEALVAVVEGAPERQPEAEPAPAPVLAAPVSPAAAPAGPPKLSAGHSWQPLPVARDAKQAQRQAERQLPKMVYVLAAVIGIGLGVWLTFPVAPVDHLCPPAGEGQGWCAMQKQWLPAICTVVGVMLGTVVLTWLLAVWAPLRLRASATAEQWPRDRDPVQTAAGWTVRRPDGGVRR